MPKQSIKSNGIRLGVVSIGYPLRVSHIMFIENSIGPRMDANPRRKGSDEKNFFVEEKERCSTDSFSVLLAREIRGAARHCWPYKKDPDQVHHIRGLGVNM